MTGKCWPLQDVGFVVEETKDMRDARFVFRYLLVSFKSLLCFFYCFWYEPRFRVLKDSQKFYQVCIAALESFAHGANDTANASSAFSAVYQTYKHGDDDCDNPDSPPWLMALVSIC